MKYALLPPSCLLPLFLSAFFMPPLALSEEYKCAPPTHARVQKIDYSNERKFVVFTVEGYPDKWMALSEAQGIDTPYGKTMTSILLTAFLSGAKMNIGHCNEGYIEQIAIEDPS
jgi:hypothetical protein